MKNIFSSVTVWGVAISMLGRVFGLDIGHAEGADLAAKVIELWPVALGVIADLGAFWHRITAVQFNKGWWASPVFWSAALGVIMTCVQMLGVNIEGMETLPERLSAFAAQISSLVGGIVILIGRARATKQLTLK